MICLKYQNGHISEKCLLIMVFPNKHKRFFSHKSHKLAHPPVIFTNVLMFQLKRCFIQKHLGIHLDEKLNFNHHVKKNITKTNKGTGMIKKLSK